MAGMIGGAFGRALAGFGAGVSSLATHYLKEEDYANRARLHEELAQARVVKTDEYMNSPERRALVRAEDAKDAEARSASTLAAKVAEAKSPELRQAGIDAEIERLQGTGDARAAYEGKVARERALNTPYELNPGQQRFMGGSMIGENTRQTPAEASLTAYREGLKGSAKVERLSEAGRLQLAAIEKRDSSIQELIDKGIADGTLTASPTGPDGKPSPGYDRFQYLQQQRQAGAISKLRLLANEGALDGAEDAQRLIDAGMTPADIQASLDQAKLIGGRYASDFSRALQPVAEKAASTEHKMASIAAAAKSAGDGTYRFDINGQTGEVGGGKVGPAKKGMLAQFDAPPAEEPPAAKAYDAARQEALAAKAELMKWGSSQREANPTQFERVAGRYEAALQKLREAKAAYEESLPAGSDRAAFGRTARP